MYATLRAFAALEAWHLGSFVSLGPSRFWGPENFGSHRELWGVGISETLDFKACPPKFLKIRGAPIKAHISEQQVS